MVIEVRVKVNSKKEFVRKVCEGKYEVGVNAQPIEGKVNFRLVEVLLEYFGVPKSLV